MNKLSLYIREKREEKGITIEELSKRTLISPAVLKDIEAGKFDKYSGEEAYVKMYLKKISNALEVDKEDLTEQYIALTREIELNKLKEIDEKIDRNMEVVEKGKAFVFSTPNVARKPSVYENKAHRNIIKGGIILAIVCMIVGLCWYGFTIANLSNQDPNFKPPTNPSVEGNLGDDDSNDTNTNDDNLVDNSNPSKQVTFNRVGKLKFEFTLPEGEEEFTLKIEFGSKSWAKLSVNGSTYNPFKSKIYNSSNDKSNPEVVELTFKKSEFKSLDLRNGYSMNHRYYINGTELPLTQDDYSEGPTDLILELK